MAKFHNLQVSEHNDTIKIETSCSPLALIVGDDSASNSYVPYFYLHARSNDWPPGERTDLHDVFSLLASGFFQAFGTASLRLLDDPNPFGADGELSSRFMTLGVAHGPALRKGREALERLEILIADYHRFEILAHRWAPFWHCTFDLDVYDNDWHGYGVLKWAAGVASSLEGVADQSNNLARARKSTGWKHYRTADGDYSVISSKSLCWLFNRMAAVTEEVLTGVTGAIYIRGKLGNYVSFADARTVERIINNLHSKFSPGVDVPPVAILLLENRVIGLSSPWVISMVAEAGYVPYKEERLRILERNRKELSILAPPSGFNWVEKISDMRFEQLVMDLVAVEPGVRRVYQVAPTRERDGGRDLIAHWVTPLLRKEQPARDAAEGGPPTLETLERKVVVQCKVRNRSIGRGDLDAGILDTLYSAEASGYLLAVSTQLSSSTTDLLDQYERRGEYFVAWWGRSEIEERLRRNPDVLRRFTDVVRPKDDA
ncbi:hypothetical protein [Streptomyces sp. NPDC020607]|uniref:hypothetical protein n=1 Tax=Streptomyces sp. NPDC020607 TaxID=3365082 RepID=UPI0037AF1561